MTNLKIPEYIRDGIYKYKYILLMCAAGILLVMLSGVGGKAADSKTTDLQDIRFDAGEIEKAAESIFSKIEGVGKVDVRITVKSGYESVYAYDVSRDCTQSDSAFSASSDSEMVTVNTSGRNMPITIKIKHPEYMGAVIVCEGGDNSKIRLELTQAMKSLTGISADNIVVAKMK
jgi:stage III sporulation protein AG